MQKPTLLIAGNGVTRKEALGLWRASPLADKINRALVKTVTLTSLKTALPDPASQKDQIRKGWARLVINAVEGKNGKWIYIVATDQATLRAAQQIIENSPLYRAIVRRSGIRVKNGITVLSPLQYYSLSKTTSAAKIIFKKVQNSLKNT